MSWPQVAIADFCLTSSGGTPSRNNGADYYGGDIPWVKSGELLDATLAVTEEHITELGLKESSAKLVPAGAVLIAMYGATVGRTALLEIDAATNQAICAISPDEKLAMNRYVWHALRASFDDLLARRVGGAQPNISQQIIKTTKLPLPPLREQRRIVELLDQADALRRLRRVSDAKVARIVPALFLRTFGDPATNPMGWETGSLGDVLAAADYGSSTRASDDGKGLPLIRMGNVSYEGNLLLDDLKFVELTDMDAQKYRLEVGDILFNRTNSLDLVGKTGIWGGEMDAVLASYFIRLRVDREKIEPVFLWAYMNCSYMKRVLRATARGAIGQANINTNELRAFPLYLPSIDKQREFVRKVGVVKESLPVTTGKLDLDNLFEILQRRAFNGELTSKWRQAHMSELLAEMQEQAKALNLPIPQGINE